MDIGRKQPKELKNTLTCGSVLSPRKVLVSLTAPQHKHPRRLILNSNTDRGERLKGRAGLPALADASTECRFALVKMQAS
jgi:hypothetical protein